MQTKVRITHRRTIDGEWVYGPSIQELNQALAQHEATICPAGIELPRFRVVRSGRLRSFLSYLVRKFF